MSKFDVFEGGRTEPSERSEANVGLIKGGLTPRAVAIERLLAGDWGSAVVEAACLAIENVGIDDVRQWLREVLEADYPEEEMATDWWVAKVTLKGLYHGKDGVWLEKQCYRTPIEFDRSGEWLILLNEAQEIHPEYALQDLGDLLDQSAWEVHRENGKARGFFTWSDVAERFWKNLERDHASRNPPSPVLENGRPVLRLIKN